MKVLMISSDRSIFESDSAAQKRMIEYGDLFKELHIIVLADRKLGFENLKLSEKVFVYPTNHEYKFLYLWNVYKIVKKLSVVSGQLSVVTTQDPFELGLAGWLLKLKYKLPLQIQIHTDIFSPYFWRESFLNKIRVLLAKFLLPKADGIRVVSERIKQSLVSGVRCQVSKIAILPIFVDVKKIQSARIKTDLHKKYPEYDFIILMASRLTKEKNIGLAIEAIKEISQTSNVKGQMLLLIVGDGPEEKNLRTAAYDLRPHIVFEPWSKDLISYYKTADMFLLTSNYEGYGRTAVEAMAAGTPVVMTDVGLAGELLVDDLDGVVIPVGGREELIRAISRLKEDKEYRENLIAESKKAISSLPEKKEYLSAYAQLLEALQASFRQKLCYVLPAFQRDDHTHFAYLNGFLEELKKSFDIYLITEKTQDALLDFLPVRAARMFFLLLYARLSGYKNYYVHYSFLGALEASLIARMSGGRVFYWNCGEPWKYKRNFIRNLFEYSVYHLISFLVTGTKSLGQQYAAYYHIAENKVKELPNWIDLHQVKTQISKIKSNEFRKKLHIAPEQRVLLFVHRLSKRKGAHYLPEILYRLKDQNIILIIAGDGPEKENIQLQISNYQLQDKVRLLGWIPQNKVLDYFAISDIFLMPSEEEGFPHVLLESMVAGVPFVATDVGGVREMIPNAALPYIVESGDVAVASEKTKALLHLRGTPLRSLQQELMQWVRRYDIKKVAEKFSEIILAR